tara:strand:- start:750 stop:1895 length:1146 start_codon:yes stop_codon:yes gene_type:complete
MSGIGNLPSNYKQQELEARVAAQRKRKPGKITAKQNFGSYADRYMSYPIARSNQEKTGDTLRIKCIQYVPSNGKNFGVEVENALEDVYKVGKDGKEKFDRTQFIPKSRRKKPISIKTTFTDANTRISKANQQNQLTKFNIELPIPQEINDSQSVTWGDDRVNAIELAGVALAGRIIERGALGAVNDARNAIQALGAGVDIPGVNKETQNAIRASLAGAAVGALGGNVTPTSLISRATGQILNNNLELLFQNVNLRSFPYSITFSPRSEDEAKVVKAIIKALKMAMAPKAGEYNDGAQGLFIKSPDIFQLQFLRDGQPHPFLHNFKLCALTGMNVNYTNAGTYASYSDGTPVNIKMDVTFKEINPIYHEDYMQPEAGDGVGF